LKSKRTKGTPHPRKESQGGGRVAKGPTSKPIRFAVVGAGHIAQNAVIPAFANTAKDCVLTTLFSDDEKKRRALSRKYKIDHALGYDAFDEACRSGTFDAVYIALPNHLHRDYTVRAANAGIHVLCEKPMAVTSDECHEMLDAAAKNNIRLMIAYRLHFEQANMKAVEIVQSGKLGDPRFFNSVFSMQVRSGNVRTQADKGGGPLFDIGIYCINAARYLFRAEPIEISASAIRGDDPRFAEIDEAVSVTMKFPGSRIASFVCSFGASDVSHYQVVGTTGDLVANPAFDYRHVLEHKVTINGKARTTVFKKRDQFAAELVYFAQCIRDGTDPAPGGREGLIDVMIIEEIERSIRKGKAITMPRLPVEPRPDLLQELRFAPSKSKGFVGVQAPTRR